MYPRWPASRSAWRSWDNDFLEVVGAAVLVDRQPVQVIIDGREFNLDGARNLIAALTELVEAVEKGTRWPPRLTGPGATRTSTTRTARGSAPGSRSRHRHSGFDVTEDGRGLALDLWHPMRPGQERRSFTAAEARAIRWAQRRGGRRGGRFRLSHLPGDVRPQRGPADGQRRGGIFLAGFTTQLVARRLRVPALAMTTATSRRR